MLISEVSCHNILHSCCSLSQVVDHLFEPGYVFCGTTSGDILGINMKSCFLQFLVPHKERFSLGVSALSFIAAQDCHTLEFLLGTGDGLLGRYEIKISRDKKDKIVATLKHKAGLQFVLFILNFFLFFVYNTTSLVNQVCT